MIARPAGVVSAQLTAHLVLALGKHRDWCRQNGTTMPDLLEQLYVTLAASDGQERTPVGVPEPVSEPLLVDHSEAGRLLGGVSVRTVRRLVASGDLPAVKVAGRSLIRRVDVETYVERLGSERAS